MDGWSMGGNTMTGQSNVTFSLLISFKTRRLKFSVNRQQYVSFRPYCSARITSLPEILLAGWRCVTVVTHTNDELL